MKFYYESKSEFFVTDLSVPSLCCEEFNNIWTSGDYCIEIYKNGIRYYPWNGNPNIYRIYKECPFCGEPIKTEKVKDIGLKFVEVYPF